MCYSRKFSNSKQGDLSPIFPRSRTNPSAARGAASQGGLLRDCCTGCFPFLMSHRIITTPEKRIVKPVTLMINLDLLTSRRVDVHFESPVRSDNAVDMFVVQVLDVVARWVVKPKFFQRD